MWDKNSQKYNLSAISYQCFAAVRYKNIPGVASTLNAAGSTFLAYTGIK
jgi:hypothetical protein